MREVWNHVVLDSTACKNASYLCTSLGRVCRHRKNELWIHYRLLGICWGLANIRCGHWWVRTGRRRARSYHVYLRCCLYIGNTLVGQKDSFVPNSKQYVASVQNCRMVMLRFWCVGCLVCSSSKVSTVWSINFMKAITSSFVIFLMSSSLVKCI